MSDEPFAKQALVFICLKYKSFENTVGKGEIAHNEQFLLVPLCFLSFCKTFIHFHQKKIKSAKSSGLEKSKACCLGRG